MTYTGSQAINFALSDLRSRLATGDGIVQQPGANTVSARPAPPQIDPVVDNVTTANTGIVPVGSLSQSITITPTNANFKAQLLNQATGSGGLELVGLGETYCAIVSRPTNKSLIGNISMDDTREEPGLLTFSTLPNGDVELRQGGSRRAMIAKSEVLKTDADYLNPAATYARLASPAVLNNVSVGQYRVEYLPLRVIEAEFGTDGIATVTFDYYMPADDVIEIELRGPSGQTVVARAASVVTENAVPGRATVKSASAPLALLRGSPMTIQLRQRTSGATTSVQRVWSAPMSLGINPVPPTFYYLTEPMANKQNFKWRDGKYNGTEMRGPTQNNAQVDYKGNVIETPETRLMRPSDFVAPPRVSGQRMRWIWEGEVEYAIANSNTDPVISNVTYGTDGTRSWMDYNVSYNPKKMLTGRPGDQLYWVEYKPKGTGATWPRNFQLLEIHDNGVRMSPGFWDDYYVGEYAKFANQVGFPFRAMDFQNAVGLAYEIMDRPSEAGDRRAGNTVSVPDLLDVLERCGCTGKLHMPMRATDNYIRTEARRSARWAKRTGRPVSWRLANEIWNNGQPNWGAAYMLGKSELGLIEGPGKGEYSNHGIVMRYWSYRNKYVMQRITEEFEAEGVLHLLDRTVELQNGNPGNNDAVIFGEPGNVDYVDAIETAPYVGGFKGRGISTVEQLAPLLRADFPIVHALAARHRDYAHSIGKAYRTYEGGYEDIDNPDLWRLFGSHQEGFNITMEILNDWEITVGGQYTWYNDFRVDKHGHALHISQPEVSNDNDIPAARIRQALFQKMAALAA